MKVSAFLDGLRYLDVDFFTGVPDSLLKPFCDTLYALYGDTGRHVVAANEGGAAALAAGHFIATGKVAVCYLQNSGIGNVVNPLASLLNEHVYGIPCVFVVGWRGEPGEVDEPQHVFQGMISEDLLSLLGLPVFLLQQDTKDQAFFTMLDQAKDALSGGKSVAFLLGKNSLTAGQAPAFEIRHFFHRKEALHAILSTASPGEIFVSTTGKTSREVFALREELGQDHHCDFLTVGSMGHAGMIALGIAKEKADLTVWCLDGDGAGLMHLGNLAVEARQRAVNLIHVLLNNGAHESVGGMPVARGALRFTPLAQAMGFEQCLCAESAQELHTQLPRIRGQAGNGTRFLEIMLSAGSDPHLGRPTEAPKENLRALMATLAGS